MTSPVFLICHVNTLVCSILLWSNKYNNNAQITPFIPVLAGQNLHMSQTLFLKRRDVWPTNCTPKDAHASVFFYTLGTPHTRYIHTHFELWGRPFCSSLLASFFLPFWCYYERNSFHTALLSHFISLIHPAKDCCWIHVNVSSSACIYSMSFIISLNNEPHLAYCRQQSAVSTFQVHYNIYICIYKVQSINKGNIFCKMNFWEGIFFDKWRLSIVWNCFIVKIIWISQKHFFWGYPKCLQNTELQAWTKFCHEIFTGHKVQTMWNL